MKEKRPKIQTHNIVLLGDFNPKILHPTWFAAQGLIREQEAEVAELVICHPEILIFSLDWLALEVSRDRFKAETVKESHYEAIRDLVKGTLDLLHHTPIRAIGINKLLHFEMESEEQWHNVGHKLAPKDVWDGILTKPGMRTLTMEGIKQEEGVMGYIRITVEPSVKVHPGVYININDHFKIKENQTGQSSNEAISILENRWNASLKRCDKVVSMLLEKLT